MLAVVTGGCKGLGASLTIELLNKGYNVIATYLTSEDYARELESKYEQLKCVKCDVRDEDAVKKLFYDLDKVDVVINNAAIAMDDYFFDKSLDDFMEVMRVNVGGVFVTTKYASKCMQGGVVINISSNNTLGYHNPISMDYNASKASVNMLTKDFAEALKENDVKVVAIAPGWIDTEAIRGSDPKYIEEELTRSNQKELLNPTLLAKKIIDNISTYKNGEIIEIKEL